MDSIHRPLVTWTSYAQLFAISNIDDTRGMIAILYLGRVLCQRTQKVFHLFLFFTCFFQALALRWPGKLEYKTWVKARTNRWKTAYASVSVKGEFLFL